MTGSGGQSLYSMPVITSQNSALGILLELSVAQRGIGLQLNALRLAELQHPRLLAVRVRLDLLVRKACMDCDLVDGWNDLRVGKQVV